MDNRRVNLETALLVSSCDSYQDLWEPYFTLFFRYWPDCPFPIYLISNFRKYDDQRVNALLVGSDKGWATNMLSALGKTNYPHFVLTMEDHLLNKTVDSGRVIRLLEYMKSRGAGYLRLYPCPGPDTVCRDNPEVGEVMKESPYRVCLQMSIWERGTILSLLKDGESPWQMEIAGSVRSNILNSLFLSAIRQSAENQEVEPPVSYICTVVEKGRWKREALEFCAKEGIRPDLKNRVIEGSFRDNLANVKNRILWSLVRPARRLKTIYQDVRGKK